MSAHHPWLRHSPERVSGPLERVSWDAFGLWNAGQLYMGRTGLDGVMKVKDLPVATARRLTPAKITVALGELVDEQLAELVDGGRVRLLPWEQPPVAVWADDVLRERWARDKRLRRDGSLCRRVKDRDRNLCRYCGQRVNWSDKRSALAGTYDHVDPDGDNTFENVVVACRRCNGKKKDRTPEQAGMPLLRPGTSARVDAASAGQGPAPEPEERAREPDPIQFGSSSGPSSARAHARDRTEPDRAKSDLVRPSPPPAGVFDAPVLDDGVFPADRVPHYMREEF